MNENVVNYMRNEIKKALAQCKKGQQEVFKRMYSYRNLTLDINIIVDNMPEEKLDWVLTQCEKTVKNNIVKGDG